MSKQIKYGKEARAALKSGVDQLANAVVTTLGPKGRNVALDREWGSPTVIHDGVTVAREISLPDPFENMGAQLVKEASSKTNDVAGDGTTTATLLAQSIINKGIVLVDGDTDPMLLKQGVEKATKLVVSEIRNMSKEMKDGDLLRVATISAQNDEIGKLIAEAIHKVGKDGVVTAVEGQGTSTYIDFKEGMEFDKGYSSPFFVTNDKRQEAEVGTPHILITDKRISAISDLMPFLEKLMKVSKDFVIIADDVDGEALATLALNKIKGVFNVVTVKAPGIGDRKREMLEDIAILTGGTVISEATGKKLDTVELSDCGHAERVWADKESTRIIGGKGAAESIQARVLQLKTALKDANDFEKENLRERIAKLTGGVAVINIGATTEVEMREMKERAIDAIGATKAALEEGIVPGGGVTLLHARIVLESVKDLLPDELKGFDILYESLAEPLKMIVRNAGADAEDVSKNIMLHGTLGYGSDYGFDVMTMKYGQMIEMGILDPAKVTRSAVENAASVAMMVLTTEALVTDIKEENK